MPGCGSVRGVCLVGFVKGLGCYIETDSALQQLLWTFLWRETVEPNYVVSLAGNSVTKLRCFFGGKQWN